jgi:hypothetical protein
MPLTAFAVVVLTLAAASAGLLAAGITGHSPGLVVAGALTLGITGGWVMHWRAHRRG